MNAETNNRAVDKKSVALLISGIILLIIGLFIISREIYKLNKDGNSISEIKTTENFQIINSSHVLSEYAFEIDPADPLSDIPVFSDYSCSVIISSNNRRNYASVYDILSYGNKFKITGSGRTIIYDGNILYIKSPKYEIKKIVNECSLEDQIGLCTLQSVKNVSKSGVASVSVSADKKYIKIDSYNDELDRYETYTVSSIDGAVLSCSINKDGVNIKSYSLMAIIPLKSEDIDEDTFRIPE